MCLSYCSGFGGVVYRAVSSFESVDKLLGSFESFKGFEPGDCVGCLFILAVTVLSYAVLSRLI